MSDTKRIAQIMDELSATLREIGESGNAFERVGELVTACERAAHGIEAISGRRGIR